ncbi:SHOCT domain-containing protein [Saliphagus sp. GCM10025334]
MDTDSDIWKKGRDPDSLSVRIVNFLSQHPDKAFRIREICDEVLSTDFDKQADNDRLFDLREAGEITEDEYERRHHDEVPPLPYVMNDSLVFLQIRIRALLNEGLVECRVLDGSASDSPTAGEEVGYYSYALE